LPQLPGLNGSITNWLSRKLREDFNEK
jgi:hypothetical protein